MQTVIEQSSIIICSYGHLTYEAMALGKAMCVVAKKNFQLEYAKVLENKNLCVSAGLIDKLNTIDLKKMLNLTIQKKTILEKQAKLNSSKMGLRNISDKLISILDKINENQT